MLRTTPFHPRVSDLNQTQLWSHWSGYLVADRYQMSEKFEYFAIRNAVGVFDTSPLYKYRIAGRDAERFLGRVLTRDIRTCDPGQAQYTIWCDDRGYVNEDGVILRHGADEFLLTAARPNLAYFSDLVGDLKVELAEVTEELGALAVQGPRSRDVLSAVAPGVGRLGYFDHLPTKIAGAPVTVSRTGFTGDLGYEIFVEAGDALRVWDAVFDAGAGHGILPFGQMALLMARVEAGLLLIGVDFESSRFAFNDEHRSTPYELGLAWMLKGLESDDRRFVGRSALLAQHTDRSRRWNMVGLVVDPADYDQKYRAAGLIPPKDHHPVHGDTMVYDDDGQRIGYATSLLYSPALQRHIALARVRPDHATPGGRANLEFTINHRYQRVGASIARLPLFNPERKTA